MKLLLAIADIALMSPLIQHIEGMSGDHIIPAGLAQGSQFIYHTRYLQHEVDVCVTGRGLHQMSYKLTKALLQKKYHLALVVGTCGSYREDIPVGTVVNIIKEKPAYTGQLSALGCRDIYEAGWDTTNTFPHIRGSLVNLNNSYMNVFLPMRKVVGVTVGILGDSTQMTNRIEKYQADVETADGVGAVYACLYEGQPFYRIAVVNGHLPTSEQNDTLALQVLNDTVIDMLQKL